MLLSYYEKRKNELSEIIDGINTALSNHNNIISNKRIISKLLIQINESKLEDLQDTAKNMAFKLIGDPAISSNWTIFENATQSEKIELSSARDILNEWVTKQFISVFFEKCINDPRRKRFWLKMSKNITSFKVFGPLGVKQKLKQDARISEFVDNRFQKTDSQKQVSAFLMHVKDYKFIEFSDPGYAFYAYKQSNTTAPSFNRKYYSVEDFRNGNMPLLLNRQGHTLYNYVDEGRLRHTDGDMKWEDVFSIWINKKAGINV